MLGDAAILAARVSDLVVPAAEPAGSPPARLDRIVAESARARDQRVVVTDAAGTRRRGQRRARPPSASLYATSGRPEFRAALLPGPDRHAHELQRDARRGSAARHRPVVDRGRVVGAVRISAGTEDDRGRSSRELASARGARRGRDRRRSARRLAPRAAARSPDSPAGRGIDAAGAGDLAARAPEEGPAELRVLARSFNQMAARPRAQHRGPARVRRQRLASAANAAHRPAASARGDLERGRSGRRAGRRRPRRSSTA